MSLSTVCLTFWVALEMRLIFLQLYLHQKSTWWGLCQLTQKELMQDQTCWMVSWSAKSWSGSRPETLKIVVGPSRNILAMSRPDRTKPPGLLRRSRMKASAPFFYKDKLLELFGKICSDLRFVRTYYRPSRQSNSNVSAPLSHCAEKSIPVAYLLWRVGLPMQFSESVQF